MNQLNNNWALENKGAGQHMKVLQTKFLKGECSWVVFGSWDRKINNETQKMLFTLSQGLNSSSDLMNSYLIVCLEEAFIMGSFQSL